MSINTANLIAKRKCTEHNCARVHFERGTPVGCAPIACCCGWSGCLSDWPAHYPSLGISRSGREADPALPWLRLPESRLISPAVL